MKDSVDLQRLLRRLTGKVPGYPYELAMASRLSNLVEKRNADAAHDALRHLNLTYVLYQSMMIIFDREPHSIAPTEIARLTGERPNNVTHICNELAARGLIARGYSVTDRRRVSIALTPAGRNLRAKARPVIWAQWNKRFAGFEVAELRSATAKIRRQLDNVSERSELPS